MGPTGFLVAPTEFVVRWTCSEGTTTESYYSLGPASELPIVERTFTLFEGPGEGVSGTFVMPERIEGSGRFAQQMTTPMGTTMSCDSGTFIWTATATGEPRQEAGPIALTLGEALDQGLVEVELQGRGGAAGDTIFATVLSKTPRGLEIEVSEGTLLESADGAVHDMVIRLRGIVEGPLATTFEPAEVIELGGREILTYLLEAYCLEFDRGNPQLGSGFSAAGQPEQQKGRDDR